MLGEIDKDYYCSADCYDKGGSCALTWEMHDILCRNYHRKWPTPEQYKEEFGMLLRKWLITKT